MSDYEDIIHLPRPSSPKRAKMSLLDRAAQFSPFAALTGYDDVIEESQRLTQQCIELDEGVIAQINGQLQALLADIHSQPIATVVYFQPDALKDGGSYVTKTGPVKAISTAYRTLLFADRTLIQLDRITAIHLPTE